ncbi:MAG: winged helix-turn-helix transcriptional regulator [Methanomicrobium sp.]|nr:winged helix-turn-helix transcriptional regulator [Methanomicrobium sp.]MBP5083125.1 winged helix-turn-helix transcriptional regulator [Methanomicrobium sp.]MBP5475096.1 winged helix-turn-helix transcriptional regulator [Methanomicrobium sp.]MBQ3717893.1 winged helix-turn-helix transcriptional regulator [Methanomicrobium sp.]MBQ4415137.1 winged helix-turn-helix transcriptional regulator [Methanomicrobium sp.]
MLKTKDKDPLYIILRSKREATKFQILVGVAENQPSVRQQEIAEILGVTPQAVSEYIRELVDDEMVKSQGRGSYVITPKGVEWVINNAEALESYAKHITHDIVQQVAVWTAIADCNIRAGDKVGVYMKDGHIHASYKEQSASGIAIADTKSGMDLGVSDLVGIIELSYGLVHVCKVPRIQRGGSERVQPELLRNILEKVRFIGTCGIEADIAVKNTGLTPNTFFGSREGVIEAAIHGLESALVVVDEDFTDFLKRLEAVNLRYVIHDLIAP